MINTNRYCISFFLALTAVAFQAAGCAPKDKGHHYLVAKRVDSDGVLTLTLTLVRKFEKENWCTADRDSLIKREFEAECRYEDLTYEPMFRGDATGKWYVLQRIGRFPPSVLIYEFDPPLPDPVILQQLRRTAPHILKFAAVHRAPAEARIFSPEGEVPRQP